MKIINNKTSLILSFFCLSLTFLSIFLTKHLSLNPCPLCILQRFDFLLLSFFFLLYSIRSLTIIKIIIGFLCFIGITMATYQSYLQIFHANSLNCLEGLSFIEDFVDFLAVNISMDFFLSTGNCSSKELTIFGLSLANLSLISFISIGFLNTKLQK